jgi:hypothetical protein
MIDEAELKNSSRGLFSSVMAVLSFVIIRQFIQKLFGADPTAQIFQFTSCCSQINHWS